MQSQVRFNGFRRRFRRRPGSLVQRRFRRRSGRFNRVPEKLPEKVPGSLGAKPSQVQHGSGEGSGEGRGEGSGEGLGGFGAEPGQVQQGSGEGSGEGLGGFGASVCFQCLPSQHARKIYKNTALRLLGIPPKLITSRTSFSMIHIHILLINLANLFKGCAPAADPGRIGKEAN